MKERKCLICNCYRTPGYEVVELCNDIEYIIDKASHEFNDVIFIGDMNARNKVSWYLCTTHTDGRALCKPRGGDGMIKEPTRIVGNTKACIDLIITNNPDHIMSAGSRETNIGVCHHRPIFAPLVYPVSKPKAYK